MVTVVVTVLAILSRHLQPPEAFADSVFWTVAVFFRQFSLTSYAVTRCCYSICIIFTSKSVDVFVDRLNSEGVLLHYN